MNWPTVILLANAVSTLFMVGLIWMVQVVHYPLFDDVGAENYARYQQRHQNNITYIVAPMMLIELVTAVLLIVYPLVGVDKSLAYVGLILVILVWGSTALLQVPCHEKLIKGFDQAAYQWLVNSNWIRTIAWSARGVVLTMMLFRVIQR